MQTLIKNHFHKLVQPGSKVILTAILSQDKAILHLYPASDNWSATCIITSLNCAVEASDPIGFCHEQLGEFETVLMLSITPYKKLPKQFPENILLK
jgi:hypothetical protein